MFTRQYHKLILYCVIFSTFLLTAWTPIELPTGYPPPTSPRFEAADCPMDALAFIELECGYLTVPEDRSQPNGQTIRLAVAIIKSDSEFPAPDPIVYLEGGPGGSALASVDVWAAKRFQSNRDFILFDQRGTGFSEPNLSCPEVDELDIASVQGLSEDEEDALLVQTTIQCRDRLIEEGVNLAAYNSAENAADLNDLRQALGYPEWNLYGISYGTRLALTAMRDYPEGIRSVALDGVYPPNIDFHVDIPRNANRAIEQLFTGCAENPACNTAFPNLKTVFFDLVAQANIDPLPIKGVDFENGGSVEAELNGDDLLNLLHQSLYDSSIITYLPMTIYAARNGDYTTLASIWSALNSNQDFSTGMYFSVQCYEEIPFNDRQTVEANIAKYPELGDLTEYDSILTVCGIWRAGAAGPIENEAVNSAIPTLILSGQYDPITPSAWANRAAETLSNSYVYEFPGLGHGTTVADACPAQIASGFVNAPTRAPDTSCINQMTGPDFVSKFHLTDAFLKLTVDTFVSPNIAQLTVLGSVIAVFLSAAFLWPLALLIYYLTRKKDSRPQGALMRIVGISVPLIAFFNLFFIGLTVGIYFYTVFEDETMFLFGVPAWASFLFIIPFLIALLTIALLLWLFPVWRRKYWNLPGRLHYSLMTLASAAFMGLLWVWRFF